MQLESLSDAIERLGRRGFTGDLRVEAPDLEDALLTLLEGPTDKKEAA